MRGYYFIYKAEKGDITVIFDDKGVRNVFLPYDKSIDLSGLQYKEEVSIKEFFEDYFSGVQTKSISLNINITPFQKKVFDILTNTGRGTLLTYGDIAKLIGCGSSQAIGQALKRNPVPIIIPCHRVVGKKWDGGFAGETSGPKMEYKKYLINIEKKDTEIK
jgi:methylated-DNA-[protein]-cysteine S-methyltransferase